MGPGPKPQALDPTLSFRKCCGLGLQGWHGIPPSSVQAAKAWARRRGFRKAVVYNLGFRV